MRVKKLLLATISIVCLQTSVQGEQWTRFQCMRDCRQDSCVDETRKEACEANCAHHDPSILEACQAAVPQVSSQTTRPTPPPRRGQAQPRPLPQPQPSSVESAPNKGDEEQTQSEAGTTLPRGRPQSLRLSQPPVLERKPSMARTDEPNGLQQSTDTARPELKKQPSVHGVTASGQKGLTAGQMQALNEGKGVKVKHMKEKLEGLEFCEETCGTAA